MCWQRATIILTIYGRKDTNVKPAVINEVTKISVRTRICFWNGRGASDVKIVYSPAKRSFDLLRQSQLSASELAITIGDTILLKLIRISCSKQLRAIIVTTVFSHVIICVIA